MACGVTKSVTGVGTVTCDNAGTSAHSGVHSGILTFTFRGFSLTSARVAWSASDAVPGRQNPITRGTAY